MKIIRITILLTLILIGCAVVWVLLPSHIALDEIGSDFAGYWTSGHLLLQGNNPYSMENLLALQQSLGLSGKGPVVIYNPPWVLTFLLPFGALNFATAKFIWLACTLFLIMYCSDRLWLIYGGSNKSRVLVLLVVATFSPMLFVFKLGQIVPFMLLGLVGFLHFVSKKQWWLAGMMTVFIAVKPHTLYLFWFALLLWALKHRLWQVLMGSAIALFCVSLPPLFFNPNVISQYFSDIVLKSYATYWATPTFGTFMRLCFGSEKYWLQYIPVLAGLIWFIFYWRVHRDRWTWENDIHPLIIISLITNIYTWSFDYLMILPAVIQAAVWIHQAPGLRHRGGIILLYIMINVTAFVATYLPLSHWYLLMPFALWADYVLLKNQLASNITANAKHVHQTTVY
jgi:hypothetical protein